MVKRPISDLPERDRMSYADHVRKSKMSKKEKQEAIRKSKLQASVYDIK